LFNSECLAVGKISGIVSTMQEEGGDRDLGSAENDDWSAYVSALAERWASNSGNHKQDRSKRREREILRAALRVFARDGISRARIGDIASEAGMPVSSIYDYFPSKEDLAYAVPIAHLARFYAEYAEAVAGKKTSRERLRLYLWRAADFARRNPDWARTLYLEIWPSVLISETDVRHGIDDYVRVLVYLIREGEERGEWPAGPDPYETAAILNGSVNQVIITWLLYRKPRDLMRAVASILDRIMLLLTTPKPEASGKIKTVASKKRKIRVSRFGA
jgi:AcrR family transcriptional regulator